MRQFEISISLACGREFLKSNQVWQGEIRTAGVKSSQFLVLKIEFLPMWVTENCIGGKGSVAKIEELLKSKFLKSR